MEGEINVRNNSERELSSKMEGEKESNSKIKQTSSLMAIYYVVAS